MSSNENDPYPVYVGTWTNWSRGQVLGATLTLPRQEADLLIAFTAFFIAFVATRVWRLMCFAIHRSCSNKAAQNVLYHQHQVRLDKSQGPPPWFCFPVDISYLFNLYNKESLDIPPRALQSLYLYVFGVLINEPFAGHLTQFINPRRRSSVNRLYPTS